MAGRPRTAAVGVGRTGDIDVGRTEGFGRVADRAPAGCGGNGQDLRRDGEDDIVVGATQLGDAVIGNAVALDVVDSGSNPLGRMSTDVIATLSSGRRGDDPPPTTAARRSP